MAENIAALALVAGGLSALLFMFGVAEDDGLLQGGSRAAASVLVSALVLIALAIECGLGGRAKEAAITGAAEAWARLKALRRRALGVARVRLDLLGCSWAAAPVPGRPGRRVLVVGAPTEAARRALAHLYCDSDGGVVTRADVRRAVGPGEFDKAVAEGGYRYGLYLTWRTPLPPHPPIPGGGRRYVQAVLGPSATWLDFGAGAPRVEAARSEVVSLDALLPPALLGGVSPGKRAARREALLAKLGAAKQRSRREEG